MAKPTRKLFGAKQYALALGSVLLGTGLALFRLHYTNGRLTAVDIGVSVFTLTTAVVIIAIVARIANRPEK